MPRTAFAARGICGFGLCGRAAREPLPRFQSTHSVRGATTARDLLRQFGRISILAPRVGRDRRSVDVSATEPHFNPRAPCGARPVFVDAIRGTDVISIHAPRVGRDAEEQANIKTADISIHAPRVGRDVHSQFPPDFVTISIHAPRVGRDSSWYTVLVPSANFNPRAPCGARRRALPRLCLGGLISIHAPRVGRDLRSGSSARPPANFNPRAPCGARLI